MAHKYIKLKSGINLGVGRMTAREEMQLYRDSKPRQGFVTPRRPCKDKSPKPSR